MTVPFVASVRSCDTFGFTDFGPKCRRADTRSENIIGEDLGRGSGWDAARKSSPSPPQALKPTPARCILVAPVAILTLSIWQSA